MPERWASKCAKLERGSTGFLLEATKEYARRKADGWSETNIAREVTAAGFPISQRTVGRRLKALSEVEGLDELAQEEAFAEAYTKVNVDSQSGIKALSSLRTREDAEVLVRSLAKAPQIVQDTVAREMDMRQRDREYVPPTKAQRKAIEANTQAIVQPIIRAVSQLGIAAIPAVIEELADDLREANEQDAITPAFLRQMDKALATLNEELEVARFKLGVNEGR